MGCEAYNNITISRPSNYSRTFPTHDGKDYIDDVKFYLNTIGLPIVSIFGFVGNILNLIILTRKRLRSTMDRLEKSAHMGLIALAVSDMMFCLTVFPNGFMPKAMFFETKEFIMYYKMFCNAFLNIFLMSSTWLTVVMATGRYLAICHPFHARGMIDLKGTRIAIITVFVLSVVFNIPYFFRYQMTYGFCVPIYSSTCYCYAISVHSLFKNPYFKTIYEIIWATIGVFIPLFILFITNICLIRTLQKSSRMRRLYGRSQNSIESENRFTPTLISIIVLFFILVCPSEFLKFQTDKTKLNLSQYTAYIIAKEITNFLQCVNFAINFVLYCAINVYFRQTFKEILFCLKMQQRHANMMGNHNSTTFRLSEPDTDL